ncbi:MAG: carbamoyltransferase HypF, partial [Planctomycetes bacterium]|nr:carbamoyltransferase HypF [Planctomycetota bacterium]
GGILGAVLEDALRGVPAAAAAARFHGAVIDLLVAAAAEAAGRTGVRVVALSGGCLQNRILLRGLEAGLAAAGLEALTQAAVPSNDGGLCLGQAWAGVMAGG